MDIAAKGNGKEYIVITPARSGFFLMEVRLDYGVDGDGEPRIPQTFGGMGSANRDPTLIGHAVLTGAEMIALVKGHEKFIRAT